MSTYNISPHIFADDPVIKGFLYRALLHADSAHSIEHAERVYHNAIEILIREKMNPSFTELIEIKLAALCHDVRDHKLVAAGLALPAAEVEAFYTKYFILFTDQGTEDIERCVKKICHIHDNCSWSKRHISAPLGPPHFAADADWMRRLVQDADWLDAIGPIGLSRCIEFTRAMRPGAGDEEVSRAVCAHIKEKLLLIPDELHFQSSRELSAGGLEPLKVFLAEHGE